MPIVNRCCIALVACLACAITSQAEDDPAHERHELMEGVGDAAKSVGSMLKEETPYDPATLREALATFLEASEQLGALFPPGSEGGEDSRAAPAIWDERAGFEEALEQWHDAIRSAIAAETATLEAARPVVGPVFEACKNCHDSYRLEED